MAVCERCECLPSSMPGTGTLYIAPPLAHTQANLRKYLERIDIPVSEPYASILAVTLAPGSLQRLSVGLGEVLTHSEMQDSKSLVVAPGVVPSIVELVTMQPLSTLLGRVQGDWLLEMLHEGRTVSHFQPIVESKQPGNILAYECLLRGKERDGSLIFPNRLFDVAFSAELLFQLDQAARLTAVRSAAQHNIQSKIFINFNPSAIYDPVYCLRTTTKAARDVGITPEQIVFEVVESSEAKDVGHLLGIMDFYRSKGFGVALDDLGAGFSSLNLLTRLKPDYVKLDIGLIRDVDQDPYKAQIASKLLELAQGLGVKTVAEGVETEGEWRWVTEHGADYVQGYYFAKPASPPPLPKVR